VAGAGGVFGSGEDSVTQSMSHGGDFDNTDFYNPDDTRIAKGGKRGGKKKKKHDGSLQPLIPLQRRITIKSL